MGFCFYNFILTFGGCRKMELMVEDAENEKLTLTVEDIQKCLPAGDLEQFAVSHPDLQPTSLIRRFVVCYDPDIDQFVNFRVINMDSIFNHINNCPDCQKWLARVRRSLVPGVIVKAEKRFSDTEKAEMERRYCGKSGGAGW